MSMPTNTNSKQGKYDTFNIYMIGEFTGKIVKTLSKEYDTDTFDKIKEYIVEYMKYSGTMLKSVLQSAIHELTKEDRNCLQENLELIIENISEFGESEKGILLELWDYSQEVLFNLDNMNELLMKSANSAKYDIDKDLRTEFKSIEKDYVAILGVLSTIIVTFVSGIAFSTSVLENMHKVSLNTAVTITLIIGAIFIIMITIECIFIRNIVNKQDKKRYTSNYDRDKTVLIVMLIAAFAVIVALVTIYEFDIL